MCLYYYEWRKDNSIALCIFAFSLCILCMSFGEIENSLKQNGPIAISFCDNHRALAVVHVVYMLLTVVVIDSCYFFRTLNVAYLNKKII